MLSSDFSSFDSRVMLEYEEFLNIYDRFKDVNFAIAYKLIERNILDNATRESIISLGESGDLEGCALLEELESKDLDLEIQKWIRVGRVRSSQYLEMSEDEGWEDAEDTDIFGNTMIMTALGNYEGMMRILVGFKVCDIALFERKNSRDNINALFEFEHLKTKIENYEIRDNYILYSMGVDFEHAPAEPIEKMIEYFNTPKKCIYHKYYCNNTIIPHWGEWIEQLEMVHEKL